MVAIPTIHLNGTDGEVLLRDYLDMHRCIEVAIDQMQSKSPNGRDYYVQGTEAFKQASVEHGNRVLKLREVADELMEIAEAIAEQNTRRILS